MEIRVTGGASARRLAEQLRKVNLARDACQPALRRSGPPLVEAAQRSARTTLPAHGGLAARVARSSFRLTDRASGTTAALRITASSDMEIDAVDAGLFHHPVFGRGLVTQRVRPGWMTGAIADAAPPIVGRELQAALDRITRGFQ